MTQELINTLGENVVEIQKVINTLEGLDIKSTFDNMNRILGSMQTLANVRDAISNVCEDLKKNMPAKKKQQYIVKEDNDGNADTE